MGLWHARKHLKVVVHDVCDSLGIHERIYLTEMGL